MRSKTRAGAWVTFLFSTAEFVVRCINAPVDLEVLAGCESASPFMLVQRNTASGIRQKKIRQAEKQKKISHFV